MAINPGAGVQYSLTCPVDYVADTLAELQADTSPYLGSFVYVIDQGGVYRVQVDGDVIDTELDGFVQQPPSASGIPVGGGMPWYGTTAPALWLMANGQAVSRSTYADLFAVIGTTYGAGDGSSTFNLPDLTNRYALGAGSEALGAVAGANTRNLQHTHGVALGTSVDGAHTHNVTVPAQNGGTIFNNAAGSEGTYQTTSNGAHSHSVTGATNTAGEAAQDMRPASLAINHIIYAGV